MKKESDRRRQIIIQYNAAGILMNLLLAGAKAIVGLTIRSRAVMLDALNGLSDVLSSLVSMISALYAGKRTDRKHPFGYGRLEYITSIFTTIFIIFMGTAAIIGAVRELLHRESGAPAYNTAVVVLMCISLIAKCVYGLSARRKGKKLRATALFMIGTETLGDAVVSLAILAAIAIYHTAGVNIENWLSILISLFIIKTGLEMVRECLRKLLGSRGDPAVYSRIKKLIAEEPDVLNVFNLVIHNYGEELAVGSVDIEVEEDRKTSDTTKLTRRIIRRAAENGVTLSSVGVYGISSDPESAEIWDRILSVIRTHPEIVRAYAFSYDPPPESAVFFVVLPDPSVRDKGRLLEQLKEELKQVYPDLRFEVEAALDV